MTDLHDDWWASLNHGGLLIAPAKIPAHFPDAPPPLSHARADRLRRDVVRMLDDDSYMGGFLDQVFESLLELPSSEWLKASDVGSDWSHAAVTGEAVRPRRLWRGPNGEVLPLFATDGKWGRGAPRIGVGKGRRAVSRVIEWLRNADRELAVLTNGRQIRLIHAGADYDAFCEWDIELWFDEGAPGPQVTALRRLLGRSALLAPTASSRSPLLSAIHESRRGQGELSAVLGERVRQAVELLIRSSSPQLEPVVGEGKVTPNEAYIAATRIVMRLVVVLFAEARELLPRVDPIYHGSYGLQGLREELDREAGGKSERLRHRHSAWPRLLGLFKLVYCGSSHSELQVPEYGGGLFQPGDAESEDAVSRALAAFESPKNALADDVVHRMIELLTRSRVKVRQGRGSTWVEAPVDFSDLSSEYIGILYEGLLDYELRRAPADDPMVFLELGDQPALPLSRLDGMTSKERGELLKKLQTATKQSAPADEGSSGDDEETESEDELEAGSEENEDETSTENENEAPADEEPADGEPAANDLARQYREMVDLWARNAVRDAGWTKRGADLFGEEVTKLARGLVRRVVLPGDWFLVRWGGTRKGAGTFYTRPQLAGPLTRRTLRPLAYVSRDDRTWDPRPPEEILSIRVCDPAMGSGSFLAASLRFLTQALFESLHHHHRLKPNVDGTIARLADGNGATLPTDETLPVPVDHESFEDRLLARLKRHVVERCIYGVDLDPVAVELAKLALWIETMDPRLPFGFLDHKLKVGNSLVGCWLDEFQDYPLMAWEREDGDGNHTNFVHHFREASASRGKSRGTPQRKGDKWTAEIKSRKALVRDELAELVVATTQTAFSFGPGRATAAALHADTRSALEAMHAAPIHEAAARAAIFAERIRDSPALRQLTHALDAWCAVWFWPGKALASAPTPHSYAAPPEGTVAEVARLAESWRFFHWEIEFPDVFTGPNAGFDAVVGNPPWDILKPNSMEFFSNLDPLYRTYTKQEGLRRQKELFAETEVVEDEWISYRGRFKALSNWVKHRSNPFGEPGATSMGVTLTRSKEKNLSLHAAWKRLRQARRGYSDPRHPYRHQGSGDLNTYKMFLETGLRLLARGGRMGFLTPSGIYSDLGTQELRRLFLDEASWSHMYAFQNERFIFPGVHHSFKMAALSIAKADRTTSIKTEFRLGPGNSPTADEAERDLSSEQSYVEVSAASISRFSPRSAALLELKNEREFEMLERIVGVSVPLGDTGPDSWRLTYAREFDMTNDSSQFVRRPKLEEDGYRQCIYGHWLRGGWRDRLGRGRGIASSDGAASIDLASLEDVAIPLYQGVMVQQFDPSAKNWLRGTGLKAKWEPVSWEDKTFGPQFLVRAEDYVRTEKAVRGAKLGFRDIARSTDSRTFIAAVLPDFACGNKVPVLGSSREDAWLAAGVIDSFVVDWAVRRRATGTSLNYFIVEELPLLAPEHARVVEASVAALSLGHPVFAREWVRLRARSWAQRASWKGLWALTPHERRRQRAILDATVAHLYGLTREDLRDILDGCDRPAAFLNHAESARTLDPVGFWRAERDEYPEVRHSVLCLLAFDVLANVGLEAFLSMNEGQGWMLPDIVRLADHGLGHDERAREPQPVASALGPRFYDWQLAQNAAESWEECVRHAEFLDQILPLPGPAVVEPATVSDKPQAGRTDLFGNPIETDLFGNPVEVRTKRGRR